MLRLTPRLYLSGVDTSSEHFNGIIEKRGQALHVARELSSHHEWDAWVNVYLVDIPNQNFRRGLRDCPCLEESFFMGYRVRVGRVGAGRGRTGYLQALEEDMPPAQVEVLRRNLLGIWPSVYPALADSAHPDRSDLPQVAAQRIPELRTLLPAHLHHRSEEQIVNTVDRDRQLCADLRRLGHSCDTVDAFTRASRQYAFDRHGRHLPYHEFQRKVHWLASQPKLLHTPPPPARGTTADRLAAIEHEQRQIVSTLDRVSDEQAAVAKEQDQVALAQRDAAETIEQVSHQQSRVAARQDRVADEQAAAASTLDRADKAASLGLTHPQQVLVYGLNTPHDMERAVAARERLHDEYPDLRWTTRDGNAGFLDKYRVSDTMSKEVRLAVKNAFYNLNIGSLRIQHNPDPAQLRLMDSTTEEYRSAMGENADMDSLHREREKLAQLEREKAQLDLRLREAEHANKRWA